MKNFIKADDSRVSYAQWKASWKPPQISPRAMKKKAVVEFMPFQAGGSLFVAEGVSKTAMMVHCHNGDVPVGTEVAIGSLNGTEFECEGRRFTIVNIDDILLMETLCQCEATVKFAGVRCQHCVAWGQTEVAV